MILFRQKLYASESSVGVAKAAGIGAGLGIAFNKIGKNVFTDSASVPKISAKGTPVLDKAGNVVYNTVITSSAKDKFGKFTRSSESKLAKWTPDFLKGTNKKFWDNLNKLGKWMLDNPYKGALAGALIGASLAIGYYLIKSVYDKSSNRLSSSKYRLLDNILLQLTNRGYKDSTDFTTNPSEADYQRMKVCISLSKGKDELALTINCINDPKLDDVSKRIIKNLPSKAKYFTKESDRSNDLILSLLSTNDGDAQYIASIAEMFIKEGYPVFLIEVS